MQFNSLENPNGDLAYEFQKWIDVVNEKEAVDVIVISSHNGFGNAEGTSLENQTQYATANSVGADLVIAGHDHTARITTVTNKDGEAVPVVNAGGSNVNLNTVTVTFDDNGGVADVAIEAENIALANVIGDEEIAAQTQHWYDETYAWASAPVGTFDNGWTELADLFTGKTNNQMVTFQNALVDFVHKGQIWASWQSYEELGIEGATVSIGSAVFAEDWSNGNRGVLGFVPVDGTTISTLELNKLYRYSNNLLCAIDMTGEQLWNWMNTTVNYYDVDENGNIYLNSSVFGTDTFYGVDYTVDLTKPYGERLVSATYQGQDLRDYDGLIRCTLNSYRLSGGYGFFEATGLTEADCCWTASMYLGSDRAPVPTMLGEYVAHMGTVTPNDKVSHGSDSTWTILTEAQPEPETIAEGWSGYTTWRLTSDGTLTVSPTAQTYNGKCNMANYHWDCNPNMPGTLGRPWEAYTEQIKKIVVEDGVNAIGQMAFYGLENLTEVVLAGSVQDIRNYAFKNCVSLPTIDLSNVLVLREGAFYGCSSLTNVDFSSVVVVAEWVFSRTGVTYP